MGLTYTTKKNPSLAKSLAAEAGYKGEKITFMVSSAYKIHADIGMVFSKTLRDAGFNIDLQVYDWATLVSKRGDSKQWDMFFTHHGFIPDPILFTFMSEAYPGWWNTPEKAKLTEEFTVTMDPKKRLEVWKKIQSLIYQQIPIVKVGDVYNFDVYTPRLKGLGTTQLIWPKFWGCSLE